MMVSAQLPFQRVVKQDMSRADRYQSAVMINFPSNSRYLKSRYLQICIGGVCVPLNLLLPFLVGVLHRYGWFNWFQQEWVT